jgi:hypothetical protein
MDQTKTLSTKFRYRNVYVPSTEKDPKIWGPKMWRQMFTVAAKYSKQNPPPAEQKRVYQYFKNLKLPCINCQLSYRVFWNQLPIEDYLSSRKLLIEWVYLIKDKVNKKLMEEEKNKEAAFTKQCLKQEPTRITFCVEYGKRQSFFRTTPSPPLKTVLNRYYYSFK